MTTLSATQLWARLLGFMSACVWQIVNLAQVILQSVLQGVMLTGAVLGIKIERFSGKVHGVIGPFKKSSSLIGAGATGSSLCTSKGCGKTAKGPVLIPKAGSLKAAPVRQKQMSATQATLPESAPIIGTFFRYSDDASLWMQGCPPGTALNEVVLHHRQRRPSLLWNVLDKFNAYLARQAAHDGDLPANLRDLDRDWNIRLALKPRNDPEETFDASVLAFFFAGAQPDIDNMINILDNFYADCYQNQDPAMPFRQPLEVRYFFNENITTTVAVETLTIQTAIADGGEQLPVQFFVAGPPWGDRHVNAILDFEDDALHLVFFGNIYPLRAKFDFAQIGGNHGEDTAAGRREYFRIPEVAALSSEGARTRIQEALTTVVQNTLIRCVVRTPPSDDGDDHFLKRLRALPQLRFTTQ